MTKRQAGRLGGLATFKKHGREHMRRIGKLGARAMWTNNKLVPIGTSNFAIVRRSDNVVVGYMQKWSM